MFQQLCTQTFLIFVMILVNSITFQTDLWSKLFLIHCHCLEIFFLVHFFIDALASTEYEFVQSGSKIEHANSISPYNHHVIASSISGLGSINANSVEIGLLMTEQELKQDELSRDMDNRMKTIYVH